MWINIYIIGLEKLYPGSRLIHQNGGSAPCTNVDIYIYIYIYIYIVAPHGATTINMTSVEGLFSYMLSIDVVD